MVKFILFFNSSYFKINSGKELNKFCPQTAATTFEFSSVFILLLWSASSPATAFKTRAGHSQQLWRQRDHVLRPNNCWLMHCRCQRCVNSVLTMDFTIFRFFPVTEAKQIVMCPALFKAADGNPFLILYSILLNIASKIRSWLVNVDGFLKWLTMIFWLSVTIKYTVSTLNS